MPLLDYPPTDISADPLALLRGRNKRMNRFSYPLTPGGGQYGLDFSLQGDCEINESEMSFTLPFGDGGRRDGVGDLLEVGGIDTSRHIKNPLVLWDHGKVISLPIGLTETRDTKEYTVSIDSIGQIAKAKVYLYQGKGMSSVSKEREYDHALFCNQIFDLWRQRLIRGGSIGYSVVQAKHLPPDYARGTPAGLHLIKTLMLECSAVVLPCNADTVSRKGLEDNYARKILCMPQICGKPISPYLIKSLTPYAEQETKTVVGFSDGKYPMDNLKSIRKKYRVKTVKPKPSIKPSVPHNTNQTPRNPPAVYTYKNPLHHPGVTTSPPSRSKAIKDGQSLYPPNKLQPSCTFSGEENKQPIDPGADPLDSKLVNHKAINVRYKKKVIKGFAEVSLKFDLSRLDTDKQNVFAAEMETAGFGRPKQGRWGGEKSKLQAPLKIATFCFDVEPESETNNAVAEAIRIASGIAHRHGARYLGNPGSKSLPNTKDKSMSIKTKDMSNETNGSLEQNQNAQTQEIDMNEPYGAQFLRQLHDDHSVLMRHYDSLLGPLEPDSAIRKYAVGKLSNVEKDLQEMEKLFSGHYKDIPGLGGEDEEDEEENPVEEAGGETKDLTEDELQDVEGDLENVGEELEGESGDTEEDAVPDEAAIEGDGDSREDEVPEPEEAVEGMKTKSMKSLRKKYRDDKAMQVSFGSNKYGMPGTNASDTRGGIAGHQPRTPPKPHPGPPHHGGRKQPISNARREVGISHDKDMEDEEEQKSQGDSTPYCKLGQRPDETDPACRRNPKWHTGAYAGKTLCDACKKAGKKECNCKAMKTKDHPCDECKHDPCICKGPRSHQAKEQDDKGMIGTVAGGAIGSAVAPGVGTEIGAALGSSIEDKFSEKDLSHIKEGSGFLNEISQPDSKWDMDGQHRAYHYGKTFEGFSQLEDINDELEESPNEEDHDIPPADQESGVGQVGEKQTAQEVAAEQRNWTKRPVKPGPKKALPSEDEIEDYKNTKGEKPVTGGPPYTNGQATIGKPITGGPPYTTGKSLCKMCKDISGHFMDLSSAHDLTDVHRTKSGEWHKEIEAALNDEREEDDQENDKQEDEQSQEEIPAFAPGETGEKVLDTLRGATFRQDKMMDDLIKQIDGIGQRVGLGLLAV